MATELFADTWYFVALHDRFDNHHGRAIRIRIRYGSYQLVTHENVLAEMLAFFSAQGEAARAVAAKAARETLDHLNVITPDRMLFRRALELYSDRLDKAYSLSDCMSMVVMKDRGITHVLTNDHHFRQEGFTVLSDAP
jgi:predicted nucleic acid-binding protein